MKAASTSGPHTGSSPGDSRLEPEDVRLEAENGADKGSDTFLYLLYCVGCSGVVKSCAECGLGGRLMLNSFRARFFVEDGGVLSIGEGSRVRDGVAEGLAAIVHSYAVLECWIRECGDTARPAERTLTLVSFDKRVWKD